MLTQTPFVMFFLRNFFLITVNCVIIFIYFADMSLISSLPKYFSLTTKKWCRSCNTVKAIDKFTHGSTYVNHKCNSCRGLADVNELDDSDPVSVNAYLKTLHPLLPTGKEYKARTVAILRRNMLIIYDNVCQGCRRTDEYFPYPFEDKYCTKPLSLFANSKEIRKANFYCEACAAKLPSKKPKREGLSTDAYEKELVKALDAYDKFGMTNGRDKISLTINVNSEESDERRRCPQCKDEKLQQDFVVKKVLAKDKNAYYIKDVCRSCRNENAAAYAREKRKYVPTWNDQDSKRIRLDVEKDLKQNPCYECGKFHTEEEPLFYYNFQTLEKLLPVDRPYASMANIRLHKSCRKELVKIRSL